MSRRQHGESHDSRSSLRYCFRRILRNEFKDRQDIIEELTAILFAFEFSDDDIFGIKTAVAEVLENVVNFQIRNFDEERIELEASITYTGFRIKITVAANMVTVSHSTLAENLEECHRSLLTMSCTI